MIREDIRIGMHFRSRPNGPNHCGIRVISMDDNGVMVRRVHYTHNGETYNMRWDAILNSQWEFVGGQLPLL